MPSDPVVWRVATDILLMAFVLLIAGCALAFIKAIWQTGSSDRRGSQSDLGRVPLTAARRANFLDRESRRQD